MSESTTPEPALDTTTVAAPPAPPSGDEVRQAHHRQVEAASRQSKLDGISIISEFESKRRGYFIPQINSNNHHWHAFASTLTRSQVENERVFDFFNERLEIESKYATLLAESPYVDLKGGGGWRKDNRKATGSSSSSSSNTTSSSNQATRTESVKGGGWKNESKKTNKGGAATTTTSTKVALPAMEEVINSTEGLAQKIREYVAATRKELMEAKLKALVSAFKETSDVILGEGGHSLDNVTKAEAAVQAAYSEYSKAVEPLAGGPIASGAGNHSATGVVGSDLWISDMNYRVAVELERNIWGEMQHKLHDLFTGMKTLELNRRQTLHGLIVRYIQNQGAFWGTIPQMCSDTALKISGLNVIDPQEVESELSDEIRLGAKVVEEREKARSRSSSSSTAAVGGSTRPDITTTTSEANLQQQQQSSSSSSSSTSSTLPIVTSPSSEPFTGSLTSPLEIALVKRVEVLEHRSTVGVESMPLLKRWRPTLSVLTIDNYLHLFDLPHEVLPGSEITPKEAFKLIIAKRRAKKGKDAGRIQPTVSLCLNYSKAKFRAEDGPEAFEITESLANTGFVKVFKSHETKRVILKAKGQEKMVDWIVEVNKLEGVDSAEGVQART